MLQSFFERLRKIIPFSSAVLIPFDPQTGQLQIQRHFLLNASVRELTLYLDHYAPLDPFALTDWTKKNLNKAACFTDVVSRSYLVDSEYGCDFLPRVPFFHGMGIMMASQGDSIGVLGLHRQKEDRNFTPREKESMNRLTPCYKLRHEGLEDMEGHIDRASNRLAFALVVASIVIGSSIIMQTHMEPMLFGYPAIGVIGYLVTGFLGLRLVWAIFRPPDLG